MCLQLSSKHFQSLLNLLSLGKLFTHWPCGVSVLLTYPAAVPEPIFYELCLDQLLFRISAPFTLSPLSLIMFFIFFSCSCTQVYTHIHTLSLSKDLSRSCSKLPNTGGEVCTLLVIPNEQNYRNPSKCFCWEPREACQVVVSNLCPPGCVTSV